MASGLTRPKGGCPRVTFGASQVGRQGYPGQEWHCWAVHLSRGLGLGWNVGHPCSCLHWWQ